jgi:transposase
LRTLSPGHGIPGNRRRSLGDSPDASAPAETAHRPAPAGSPIPHQRHLLRPDTGCAWSDVPEKYGTKSTVHRYHLELCKRGAYQAIFLDLLQSGYDLQKLDLVHCITDTKDIPRKRGNIGYDGYKKVNGNKLSALVDQKGLPLACLVAPANIHDSHLFEPTVDAFEIPGIDEKPESSPPMQPTIPKRSASTRGNEASRAIFRSIRDAGNLPSEDDRFWFDRDLYKKRGAIERFFSWIEAFKKIVPRYERYEHSFLGLIHLACAA